MHLTRRQSQIVGMRTERSGYCKMNKKLKQQNEEMNKKLSLYQSKSDEIHTLNLEELNVLESELQSAINGIKDAKERLLENRLLCVVCLTNSKNMVLQPCGHLDVCNQCEAKLPSKICPRCQQPFTNVIAIKH
eukprot:871060_1